MHSLGTTIAKLARQRRHWEGLWKAIPSGQAVQAPEPPVSRLTEVAAVGKKPRNQRMFEYLPDRLEASPALVVVLHGCGQTAAGYDYGAGWSTLADRYGFCLLFPQQQAANNPKRCFNWFLPADTERDRGEACSIRQMIDAMVSQHGIDRRRVFVTGLSAGGAMTAVMLATYPEVFAAGGIIAGLPYRAATNVQEAFDGMFQCAPRPARAWGDLVRAASPHRGPWPRVSVWHGDADVTIKPANAGEIIKQWSDVHGLAAAPTRSEMVDGYPRQVWRNLAGEDVIESYTITSMAHGTPLATSGADDSCGVAGAFLLDVGISSSYHIAKFFRLTGHKRAATVRDRDLAAVVPSYLGAAGAAAHSAQEQATAPRTLPIDVGAVIRQALRAAGLMKQQ